MLIIKDLLRGGNIQSFKKVLKATIPQKGSHETNTILVLLTVSAGIVTVILYLPPF